MTDSIPKASGKLPSAIAVGANQEPLTRRVHAEPPHPYRTPFARDAARILHSRAFRRLAGKTQVFTQLPTGSSSDHFRSRLTHTLEVTQIARTLAATLGLNTELTEALALVHDIGHPPFGHAGEKALDEALRGFGLSFDHNLHALRIVTWFEERYAAFRGLNLTLAAREGIVKHSRAPVRRCGPRRRGPEIHQPAEQRLEADQEYQDGKHRRSEERPRRLCRLGAQKRRNPDGFPGQLEDYRAPANSSSSCCFSYSPA